MQNQQWKRNLEKNEDTGHCKKDNMVGNLFTIPSYQVQPTSELFGLIGPDLIDRITELYQVQDHRTIF